MSDISWMTRGACRAVPDPSIFFPIVDGDGRPNRKQLNAARKVCFRCEVRVECLTYAIENNEFGGVWGGTSEYERLKRKGDVALYFKNRRSA